jgi:KipI family sensor histidine kinase inhibitor
MPAVAAGRLRAIPVVYDGPDLASVAELAERDEDEVIDLHTATELRVLFCGFAPGFAYLGDVAAPLAVPRLPTPRARTPAGSVALADGMSGIYPAELPGGWRVIGRTPLVLFDPRRDPPAYLVPGDRVRFERIGDGDWDARGGEADDW